MTANIVSSLVLAWTPGPWEIMLILAAMLLLFGRRLPEVGRSLGRGLVEFKKGMKGIEDDAVDVEVVRKQQQQQQQQQQNRGLGDSEANPAGQVGNHDAKAKEEEVSKSA